jgi:hypothetical protein
MEGTFLRGDGGVSRFTPLELVLSVRSRVGLNEVLPLNWIVIALRTITITAIAVTLRIVATIISVLVFSTSGLALPGTLDGILGVTGEGKQSLQLGIVHVADVVVVSQE